MNHIVNCPRCGDVHIINPSKHKYRDKLCTNCRAKLPGKEVIA